MNKKDRTYISMPTGRSPLAVLMALLVAIASLSLASSLSAQNANAEEIDYTKQALQEWIETQRIISKEKKDLEIAREMLTERIELVQREIQSFKDKIQDTEKSIAEADKKRQDMLEENQALKQASASLEQIIISLEQRTKSLLKRLPDPIRERVKPLSQRLPEDSTKTELSTSQRFQNIVGILNEIDKFNREISVTSEVRTLEDNSSVEVAALYIGIGQAYYTSVNSNVAGMGFPDENSWTWEPYNNAAEQIADAIAILKNEKPATFVKVPVQIK